MINDFLFRVRQYAYDNRAKLIRALLIAIGAIIFAALIWYGAEYVASGRLARKIAALEALERDASARAKEAEAEAETLKNAIEAKYAQIRAIQEQAARAETALMLARRNVEPLRKTYEQARSNIADIPADTTCADACKALAAVGFPCQ
jgi:hypothetical protein